MTTVHDKVDVVTVGAGFSASILAERLCSDGRTMVSLEQGTERWTYPDFAHNHDSLRYSSRYAMMMDLEKTTVTWRPTPRDPALPMRQYGAFHPGQGLGGSIVHWSAQLWRFLPQDFALRSHYVERYGEDKLPPGSRFRDWPVTYDELEPYYDAFDYDIGSSGKAGNLRGERIPGGNVFEGPRSREYPNPPLTVTPFADKFGTACERLGHHPFVQPAGILSRGWRNPWGRYRSACMYCGFCTRFGCEVDAKASPQNTHLPVALETGNLEVRVGCKVLKVDVGADGRATGVTYVDGRGEEHRQPAELVVLSAYTLENIRLLLLSRGPKHERGIGNDRGLVGTNFTHQLFFSTIFGVFPGEKFNMYMGNTSTIKVIYDLYGDVFDHGDLDFVGGAQLFSQPCEREPITSVPGFEGPDGKTWGAAWKRDLRRNWDSHAAINIQGDSFAYDTNFCDLDPNYTDPWGRPLLRISFDWQDDDKRRYKFLADRSKQIMEAMGAKRTFGYGEGSLPSYDIFNYKSTHATGGAITGDDAGASVCNSYGQLWDTPNVFVTGACMFPQNPGANPSGTIAALTYRAADAIRDRWFGAPDELLS